MQLKRVSWTDWVWIVIIISLFTFVFCNSFLSYLIGVLINYSPFPLLGRLKFCLLNSSTHHLDAIKHPYFWCLQNEICSGRQVGFKHRIHVSYCSLAEEVRSVCKIFLLFGYSVHVCPYCFASYCHFQHVCYKKNSCHNYTIRLTL